MRTLNRNIPVSQLHQDLESGKRLVMIDVRTPVEHEETRIRNSLLMPLDRLDPVAVKTAAGDDPCVLVCHSGKRAERACQKLLAAGCEGVKVLEGGVLAWQAAGLPLERAVKTRLPLIRQVQLVIGVSAFAGSVLALTVDKNFALIPAVFCGGLALAGATGWCGLATILSKLPWNRVECGDRGVTSCSI